MPSSECFGLEGVGDRTRGTQAEDAVPFFDRDEANDDFVWPDFETRTLLRRRCASYNSCLWLSALLFLLGIIIAQNVYLIISSAKSNEPTTELEYLKPHIRTERTRFAGALRATPDGSSLYVPEPALDTQGRRFTGPPSPEIDEAWHNLLYGRYVRLTDAEVNWLNSDPSLPSLQSLAPIPNSTFIPLEGFYGGPDMLHSLHCLNGLRKHLHPQYYHPPDYSHRDPVLVQLHMEHCIEQLRQAVFCQGDMTPVTLKPVWDEKGEVWGWLGETERVHGCRNGRELGELWRERGEMEGRVGAD
ncbi:hypothetical protein LTR62_007106 [Meristemomyces frigidus]|uniref:DUF3328 domain-containing protein n=1 Tax=Meristemomyces frigidus TaxID=1508187 RepID=A0AAN7TJ90_9PEZI|nr:hypothetical protein LTR62_007106 [Meristemomyces frigidus]